MSFALSNVMIGSGEGVSIKDSGVALSGLGGISINSGIFEKAFNDTNTPTTISHNLGKTPKRVSLISTSGSGSGTNHYIGFSQGTYINNSNICIYSYANQTNSTSASGSSGTLTNYISNIFKLSASQLQCSITTDNTNIYFNWTKGSSTTDTQTVCYLWEAIA